MEEQQPPPSGYDITQLQQHFMDMFNQTWNEREAERQRQTEQREEQLTNEFNRQLRAQAQAFAVNAAAGALKPEKITVQPFDGKPELYMQFENGLRSKFRRENARFADEEAKVLFAIGLLQKEAATRMSAWINTYQGTDHFTLVNLFAQMKLQFGQEDSARKAMTKLQNLRQEQKPFEEYLATFNRLLYESEGGLSWNDSTKISWFQRGMTYRMQTATLAVIENNSFEEYIRQTKIIAERAENLQRRTPWRSNNPRGAPAPPADQMDWTPTPAVGAVSNRRAKWVDAQEIQRRRDNRLCYRCGSNEHIVQRCPYKPPVPPGQRPAPRTPRVAVVRIEPELEDEDDNQEEVENQGNE